MIELSLPEPSERIPLPLELRTVKGAPTTAPPRLDDRVILGDPAALRLTPEAVSGDTDLRAFVMAERARACYWLVQFTCTFEHDDDVPFATAWIQLNLGTEGGTAIAHSMEPARLAQARTISWSAKLVVPCVLQPEVGIGGDRTTEEVFCEASREGTAQPSWKYFRTSSLIRGLQRMRLVVRTPSESGLSATVRIGATASHQRFGHRSLSYDMPAAPARPWLDMPPE